MFEDNLMTPEEDVKDNLTLEEIRQRKLPQLIKSHGVYWPDE